MTAICRFAVTNDIEYEGIEEFELSLIAPVRALLGSPYKTKLIISDPEDGSYSDYLC